VKRCVLITQSPNIANNEDKTHSFPCISRWYHQDVEDSYSMDFIQKSTLWTWERTKRKVKWKFERSTNGEIRLSINHFSSWQHILQSLQLTYGTLHKFFQFIILELFNQQSTQSEWRMTHLALQKRKKINMKIWKNNNRCEEENCWRSEIRQCVWKSEEL
jgi:hypothetical protein